MMTGFPLGRSFAKGYLGRYLQRYNELRNSHGAELALTNALRLRRADELVRGVFENSFDAIAIFGDDGAIETANDALLELFGYPANALTGRSVFDLLSEGADALRDALAANDGTRRFLEGIGRRRDGSSFPVEIAVGKVQPADETRSIAVVRDISDRRSQQEQLRRQALHDALTDLPNRALFGDRLAHAIAAADRNRQPIAVIFLDLDRFKEINDTLGHFTGDMVIREVANRLREAVRKCDTVARLGGDEFAVLLPQISGEREARDLAERLVRALIKPILVGDILLDIGISAGVAVHPSHAADGDRLMQCADVAMYSAKARSGGVAIYEPSMDHNSLRNLTMVADLRQAIANGDIFLVYQPKIDLRSGRVTGVEALARWTHDKHGIVPPNEFVVHAERTGLIQQLTLLTLGLGLNQLAEWSDEHLDLAIAVNLSARSLHDSALPELLVRSLDHWGIEPARLTLEITESALMLDPKKALRVAERLAAIGIRLAIDDFGTGYSSMAYLSCLPVSEIKIDKSFVLQMLDRERDLKIVQSTVHLAHNLGVRVVAEGVENEQTLARLRDLGCDVAQGYFIGKPMNPNIISGLPAPFLAPPAVFPIDPTRTATGDGGASQAALHTLEILRSPAVY
jgi:diguanylate cyclase (GGDEF)-like protein/PAS domain S-box-containing protein